MSYAIQNTDGEHLGFLFVLAEKEGSGGDCIFRSLPFTPELFDAPESELLFHYQELGEFQWAVTQQGLEIQHPETGETAAITGDTLNINGLIYRVVDMGAL
jgi:hypothetical protein